MKEMSFDEYLIRESFPELSDEEVEKILKKTREEGGEKMKIYASFIGVIKHCSDAWNNRVRINGDESECYAPFFVHICIDNKINGKSYPHTIRDVFHLYEEEGQIDSDCSENRRLIGLLNAVNGTDDDIVNPYETDCAELVGKFVRVCVTDEGLFYKPTKLQNNAQ